MNDKPQEPLKLRELELAARKLCCCVLEMKHDSENGDYTLPKLAQIDFNAIYEKFETVSDMLRDMAKASLIREAAPVEVAPERPPYEVGGKLVDSEGDARTITKTISVLYYIVDKHGMGTWIDYAIADCLTYIDPTGTRHARKERV